MAGVIYQRIDSFLCKRPNGKVGEEWDKNIHYLGLIEARGSLMLPMHIMRYQKEGRTPEEIRVDFPKYETSLPNGWEECLLNLNEVAGLVKPNRFLERDRAQWIRHWKYLWECNRRNEAKREVYPGNTATDEAIFKVAKEKYPDIDLKEITGG